MRTLLVAIVVSLCGCISGYGEGMACDINLTGRDCQPGLVCITSYDECPQYGCARCRKFCTVNTDCTPNGCDREECVYQSNDTFQRQGLCRVCSADFPYLGGP